MPLEGFSCNGAWLGELISYVSPFHTDVIVQHSNWFHLSGPIPDHLPGFYHLAIMDGGKHVQCPLVLPFEAYEAGSCVFAQHLITLQLPRKTEGINL